MRKGGIKTKGLNYQKIDKYEEYAARVRNSHQKRIEEKKIVNMELPRKSKK